MQYPARYRYVSEIKQVKILQREDPKDEESEVTGCVRVEWRKIHLTLKEGFEASSIYPEYIIITQVKRKGDVTYSIKGLFPPEKPRWQTLVLNTTNKPEPKWKYIEKGLNFLHMSKFLEHHLGEDEAFMAVREVFMD